jgi:hypothetical protein
MADAYLTISEIAMDQNMVNRVTACAAQQKAVGAPIEFPPNWALENRFTWASSPSWGEKYDYAKATHEEPGYAPGADPAVITDGDILATVQAMAPIHNEEA